MIIRNNRSDTGQCPEQSKCVCLDKSKKDGFADHEFISWIALKWTGVILVLAALLLYFFGSILLPFLAGSIIAYLLKPIANKIEKISPYESLNAFLCVSVFFLGLGVIFFNIVPSFVSELVSLVNNFSGYFKQVVAWLEIPVDTTIMENLFQNSLWRLLDVNFLTNIMFRSESWAWLWDSGYQMLYFLYLILITPMVTFYMLKDWKVIVDGLGKLTSIFVAEKNQVHVHRVLSIINNSLSSFAHGQFLVAMILATYYIFTLTLLGLDSSVFIGLFSSIMIFVPYFGAMVNVILASVVAIGQFSPSLVPFLFVLLIYTVGQVLEDVILLPVFLGTHMRLHPLLVIIVVFVFAQIFGIVGILVSVPFLAMVRSLLVYALSLYSRKTPPKPEEIENL